mmetsp:Transcript_36561/g.53542  ORF Transcript_36561/g.53542 Transcript_36561/m.53542 type:complete len:150 (+) Transcript_36561:48-497(+)
MDDQQQQQQDLTTTATISSKKFLITTGANPTIQPLSILQSAKKIDLPILTYRSLFQPDGEGKSSDLHLWNIVSSLNEMETNNTTTTSVAKKKKKMMNIVIAVGGPVRCEVAQILSRLAMASSSSLYNNNTDISVTIVAPTILSLEDVSA